MRWTSEEHAEYAEVLLLETAIKGDARTVELRLKKAEIHLRLAEYQRSNQHR